MTETTAPSHRIIVLVCAGAMFISYIDRVTISVAALSMQREFGWTDSLKGLILSAFFVGYLLMQVVGGWLAHVYGGRRVLLLALGAWSVATLLTPLAAHAWLPALIAIRILLGMGEGPLNPAAYQIMAQWVPKDGQTRAVAFYSSTGFLGTFAALACTGWLVQRHGWPFVFYLFGALGVLYVLLAQRFLPEAPRTSTNAHADEAIPWRSLLSLRPFWALTFAFFCTSWIFYVLLLWMPSYFARTHGIGILGTGLYSLLPWLVMFVMMNLAGWLADVVKRRGMTLTRSRKLFACSGLTGAGAMLMLIDWADTPMRALILLCLTLAFLAFAYSSHAPNVFDITPRHAHVMFSVMNTFGSLPGIIGVALTGVMVQVTGSYEGAFAVAGVLAWAGAAVYLVWGSGRKLIPGAA